MREREETNKPNLESQILKEKGITMMEDIASTLGVGVDVVKATIDELQKQGYGISSNGGAMLRTYAINGEGEVFDASKIIGKDFKFGVVSDPHLGSKKERVDDLQRMYDIFVSEGITHVFNPGDITEGVGVYKGQELEVKVFGQEAQIDYAAENYPVRDNITTHFITGNHDLRAYEKGGVDPGPSLQRRRPDMHYLGQAVADVRLANGVTMELLHPAGGMSYALSYKAQRYINNLNPDDVKNIMIWGHYHTSFYMHYRNIHFVQAPCFKDAGIFEKRLGLNPTIGGWIVEGKISDYGSVERFKPELFQFGKNIK